MAQPTTHLPTLSLHDALPIYASRASALPYADPTRLVALWGNVQRARVERRGASYPDFLDWRARAASRSEEHTSELQSRRELVCRLLLEKKNYGDELRVAGGKR